MLYLVGGNGGPNFGDELIVAHWLRRYRRAGRDGPIVVDGKGGAASARLLRGFGDVEFVARIPRHAEGREASYAAFAAIGRAFARENAAAFVAVAAIHFCGGGYVSANWRNATRLLAAAAELRRIHGFPLVATGLGVGPFHGCDAADRRAWREIVDDFDLFECRDRASHEGLVAIVGPHPRLTLGLDDAFLEPVAAERRGERRLHLSGWRREALFDGANSAEIGRLLDGFDRVLFWTCCRSDLALRQELKAAFPNVERCDADRLLNAGLPIAPQDFMLTSRFHPHLQAARIGMPGRYAAQSPFYRAKHDLALELGSRFRPARRDALGAFSADASRMTGSDAARVEAKGRVADVVVSLTGGARGAPGDWYRHPGLNGGPPDPQSGASNGKTDPKPLRNQGRRRRNQSE